MSNEPSPLPGDHERQNVLLDDCEADLRSEARLLAARVTRLAELVAASAADSRAAGERRYLEMEVAGSLRVGQFTASRWLAEADRFVTALPGMLALLATGELFVHQSTVLLHATAHCPVEIAREAEGLVLDEAAGLCPADLRRLVVRTVLQVESECSSAAAAEQRHADAAAERRTFTRPEPDGMGLAGAVLTAEQLRCWSLGIDALERAERVADREGGVERSADQRRADLFAALPSMLLDARAALASAGLGPGNPAGTALAARIVLNVHVPVATVLELSREPGTLDGYGPISAEHVRLLRPAAFRRVLVDATSGRPLSIDDHPTPILDSATRAERRSGGPGHQPGQAVLQESLRGLLQPDVITDAAEPQHDPSARLARLVDLRDVRCCGPGCGSTRNHRDHLVPWPAGPTAAWNLGPLSARCHGAKHTGWTLVRHVDGSTTWTSPLGRTYQRPSPHAPPPRIDLFDDSPPPLDPPVTGLPWWGSDDPLTPPEPPPADSPLPDDPPF